MADAFDKAGGLLVGLYAHQPLGRVEQVDGAGAIGQQHTLHPQGLQHVQLNI